MTVTIANFLITMLVYIILWSLILIIILGVIGLCIYLAYHLNKFFKSLGGNKNDRS